VLGSLGSLAAWCANPKIGPVAMDPQPWVFLRHLSLAMAPLTFLGLAALAFGSLRRGTGFRWVSVYALHAAAEIVFYAWLFTGVANQSYVSSLYSLYPLFVAGLAASFDPVRALGLGGARLARASSWAAPVSSRLGWALTAFFLLGNAAGVSAYLRTYKGPEYLKYHEYYRDLGQQLRSHGFNPATDRVMIQATWNLYAADHLRILRLPDEPLSRIVGAMRRFGAAWILVPDEPSPDVKRSITRPFRLTLYEARKDRKNFWEAFHDDKLGLTALRIKQ
jgi:hypothetical protein